jgi:hypothetical protein
VPVQEKHAMRKLFVALLLFCPTMLLAKTSPSYSDGVFVSFQSVAAGRSVCSGTVGNTGGYVGNCRERATSVYVIKVGNQSYSIEPDMSPGKKGALVGAAVATAGFAALFVHSRPDLYGVLPGTPIKVRSENGIFYVKCGKHESRYSLVGVE